MDRAAWHGRRATAGRTVVAALLVLGSMVAGTLRAAAQTRPPSSVVTIELRSQTIAVDVGQPASVVVRVIGAPADADIDLIVSSAVDEAGVRDAARGRLPDRRAGFLPRVPLASAAVDAAEPSISTLSFTVVTGTPQRGEQIKMPDPGVYPIRVRVLAHGSGDVLAQLVTFVDRPIPGVSLPVALALPLPGKPALRPDGTVAIDGADRDRLVAVTQLLADRPKAAFTLAPRPELLDALARTKDGVLDRLATAITASGGGDRQVLAGSFVRLDLPAMLAADLSSEVANQYAIGDRAVGDALAGVRTDRRIFLADGPLDTPALAALVRLGVQTLVVPADRVQPSPSTSSNSSPASFDHPVDIALDDPSLRLQALVVDPALRARLQPTIDPVGVAHQLAFELMARARSDDPGRGVVLMPPDNWTPDLGFLRALIDVLSATTSTRLVTLDGIVRSTTLSRDGSHQIAASQTSDLSNYAKGLFVTRVAIDHLTSVLPRTSHRFDGMAALTTMAGSADLSPAERQSYLDAVNDRLFPVRRALTATARSQITLAGRSGTLPVTIANSLDEDITVKLHIASTKLTVADNDRTVVIPAKGSVNVPVDVEARTSAWRFPVEAQLLTVVGDDRLSDPATFDLRVVGLSGLGIGVSAGAALVLLTWWFTHSRGQRRRNRAKRLHASGRGEQPDGATV